MCVDCYGEDLRAETAEELELKKQIEAAIRVDDAFQLVDMVLAWDPEADTLRAALDGVQMRRVCRKVSLAAMSASSPIPNE